MSGVGVEVGGGWSSGDGSVVVGADIAGSGLGGIPICLCGGGVGVGALEALALIC
jgi:hypothetical protein